MPRFRFSILTKLMLMATVPVVLVAIVIGTAFEARQRSRGMAALEEKLERYAHVASEQVETAIAFDDRETASETLDALAHDPDVTGVQLYGRNGVSLHASGFSLPLAQLPRIGRPFKFHEQLVLAVPVVSLEGPKGTLMIAVTLRNLAAERVHAVRVTVVVGALAVLLSLALAYSIARGLSRRVRKVQAAAMRVAAGDLHAPPLAVDGSDEISHTANAINVMLVHLRDLIASRLVLDHVSEGLATIAYDGSIVGETSRAMDALVGPMRRGDPLWLHLPARAATALEFAFSQLSLGVLPLEVALDQLPGEVALDARTLAFAYTPLPDERLLVAIRDVTVEREHLRIREAEEESLALFRSFKSDRHAVRRFVEDGRVQIATIAAATEPGALLVPLHTLKGNASMLHLDTWAARCHAAETMVMEVGELTTTKREELAAAWRGTEERTAPILAAGSGIDVSRRDFARLGELARDERSWAELRRVLEDISLEPAALPLQRLGDHCRDLADRRGRMVQISVDDGGVRLDPHAWNPLWSALVHVARNAVTHGLPEGRAGAIRLSAKRDTTGVMIEIADDGDGIRWEQVAARAAELGLPHGSRADLIGALFASQLSTQEQPDELSGRGVGLAAIAEACDALGVSYDVISDPGEGTAFRFWLPTVVGRRVTCGTA